jgi:hypothetical protein
MEEQRILTIRQAAERYGFPEFGLRTLIKRKEFPVIQCGNRCYITPAVLEAYISKGGEVYDAKKTKKFR